MFDLLHLSPKSSQVPHVIINIPMVFPMLLWMEEILHQLVDRLSPYNPMIYSVS